MTIAGTITFIKSYRKLLFPHWNIFPVFFDTQKRTAPRRLATAPVVSLVLPAQKAGFSSAKKLMSELS